MKTINIAQIIGLDPCLDGIFRFVTAFDKGDVAITLENCMRLHSSDLYWFLCNQDLKIGYPA